MAQLKDKKGKFIGQDRIDKMSDEELDDIIQYNIDNYGWKPDDDTAKNDNPKDEVAQDKEINKTTEKEENTPVSNTPTPSQKKIVKGIFGSRPSGLRIREDGFDIRFKEGKYETSDPGKIAFLRKKAKKTIPYVTVTVLSLQEE